MNKMSDVELLMILGFYYVGKEKNIDKFTALFNSYFSRDLSVQTILHEVSKFKNINPANNVDATNNNERYRKIWNEYIGKDKVERLRAFYKSFKNGESISLFEKSTAFQENVVEAVRKRTFEDEPKEIIYEPGSGLTVYKRKHTVVENALFAANYTCESNFGCELFVRRNGNTNYTEAHHLIPLKFQSFFEYSLDVEANVVSLCPRCHKLLHYGIDYSVLLKILYDKRAKRLEKCLIPISYEELLLLYANSIDEDI